MNVFCFGNEFIKEDGFAKELIKGLNIENINFIPCKGIDDVFDIILSKDQNRIIILDVVKGTKKPLIIKGADNLRSNKLYSLHDFDVSYFLKLASSLGRIKKDNITIIGVPQKGYLKEIRREVKDILNKIALHH